MIKLPDEYPHVDVLAELARWQAEISRAPEHSEKVRRARGEFDASRRRKSMISVRKTLESMCHGALRCCYCEDSRADEIDHIRPKYWYPDEVFVWKNFLLSCGRCNGIKQDKWGLVIRSELLLLVRGKGDPCPPSPGRHAFIDPRAEDPLEWLEIDLCNTFYFMPRPGLGNDDVLRAEFTIDTLGLNQREELVEQRAEAYCTYRARMRDYLEERRRGRSEFELRGLAAKFARLDHPTVWREMQRQYEWVPELQELFKMLPEARDW